MDKTLLDKEKELEKKKLEDEIATTNASIAEKKAFEKRMKKENGTDWKHILGVVGRATPNSEKMQDLLSLGVLREAGDPRNARRLR